MGGTMNVMIIYDDRARAVQAKIMLERATHRADETLSWNVKPWRLDMLMLPSLATRAIMEAAEAHLIVLALGSRQAVVSELLDWLERWAASRQVQETALALWDGGNGAGLSLTATPELSQFAQRHGLSLILESQAPAEDGSAFIVRGGPAHPMARATAPLHFQEQDPRGQSWRCDIAHAGRGAVALYRREASGPGSAP